MTTEITLSAQIGTKRTKELAHKIMNRMWDRDRQSVSISKAKEMARDWLEVNWVDINGGGVITKDQIDEMNRRITNYEHASS